MKKEKVQKKNNAKSKGAKKKMQKKKPQKKSKNKSRRGELTEREQTTAKVAWQFLLNFKRYYLALLVSIFMTFSMSSFAQEDDGTNVGDAIKKGDVASVLDLISVEEKQKELQAENEDEEKIKSEKKQYSEALEKLP